MKKILTIMALLVAFVSTGFAQKTVYFNPNVWATDNPAFAVYYWGGTDGSQWVELNPVTGEAGFYMASIPDDAIGMLFGRFPTGTTVFSFDNIWNQSADAIVNDGYLYTITEWGSRVSPVSSEQVIPSNVLVAGDGEITKDFQNWVGDPTQSSNKMTLDNGFTYKLTIEGQVVKAGTYEYKIVEDNNWYPQTNDNAQLEIDVDGVYTIVYTFNVRTKAYDAQATKTDDATITYKYFVQEYASGAYTSLGEMTTVTEGENANKFAALKINRTITEATTLAFKYEKVMYNGTTVVRDEWIGGTVAGDDNMYNLTQEINEAGTYDITFNFWFENKTNWVTVEKYAEITSVKVMGSFDTWGNGIELTKGTGYTYTGTIPVSANGEEFCIKVNSNTWLKYTDNILADNYTFVTDGNDDNFKLSGDYESYVITATWTPGPDASAGWTLTLVPGEPRIAEIESVIVTVPGAPVEPFIITGFKTIDADGNYVYSIDMDLSVVLDDIPFNFTINGETLPVSADMLDPSGDNLLETISIPISSYLLKNVGSGYAVYTATATWTPNPSATSQWKLLVVGKDPRPEATTYSILYNTTGNAADWKVGDTMTESDGEFTATIKNKPGMLFAIAPTGSVGVMGIQWNQIFRPVTGGQNWKIEFADYEGTTELNAEGKVWAIDAANNADVTIGFTPGEPAGSFTITNELEFTIGQYGYSTYSNAKKYKVANATANFVTVSGSEATLVAQAEGAILPAMTGAGKGSGIIISGTAGAKATIKSANQSDDAVDSSANLLAGSGDNTYDIGTQFADGDEYTAYIFTKPEGKDLGFYLLDPSQGATLAAHKAFLAVPKTGGAPQFIGFGGTTGINSVERGALNVEGCYTLDGRRVENPTKGLYIINGKKVVIK